MSHHGSKLYRKNHIKYMPQDLKIIKKVWFETTSKKFRPNIKISLDELVEIEIGHNTYAQISDIHKREMGIKKLYYIDSSGHANEIPRKLKSLIYLAISYCNFKFFVNNDNVYVSQLNSK